MAGGGLPTTEVRGSPVATVRVVATGSEEIGSRLNRFGRPRRLHRWERRSRADREEGAARRQSSRLREQSCRSSSSKVAEACFVCHRKH